MSEDLFPLGQIMATPGALEALAVAGQVPSEFLSHHVRLEAGDLDSHDQAANKRALKTGERIFSAYRTEIGTKLWIITEWNRSLTTILTPDEY